MFLCDRLLKLGPPPDIDVLVASDSAADIEIARASGTRVKMLPVGAAIADRPFAVNRYLTKATYYRIFLPAILGDEYDRILHLDADIYVHGPKVFGLFDLDMGAHALGAVRDLVTTQSSIAALAKEVQDTLAGGIAGKYFNAGTMLFDVANFRAQGVLERFLRVVEIEPNLLYLDQSALNITLKGDWLELSPSFNLQGSGWNSFIREICEPVLVHFPGGIKPWHGPRFAENHPFRMDLEQYIASSPWKGFLSRFWNFRDAWKARSQPLPTPGRFSDNPVEIGRVFSYLRDTPFADVEQGLTKLNFTGQQKTGSA